MLSLRGERSLKEQKLERERDSDSDSDICDVSD